MMPPPSGVQPNNKAGAAQAKGLKWLTRIAAAVTSLLMLGTIATDDDDGKQRGKRSSVRAAPAGPLRPYSAPPAPGYTAKPIATE